MSKWMMMAVTMKMICRMRNYYKNWMRGSKFRIKRNCNSATMTCFNLNRGLKKLFQSNYLIWIGNYIQICWTGRVIIFKIWLKNKKSRETSRICFKWSAGCEWSVITPSWFLNHSRRFYRIRNNYRKK